MRLLWARRRKGCMRSLAGCTLFSGQNFPIKKKQTNKNKTKEPGAKNISVTWLGTVAGEGGVNGKLEIPPIV